MEQRKGESSHSLGEFNVCVIGNVNVGKSSIIQRFTNTNFTEKYVPTVGTDFESTILELDAGNILVNISDLSGEAGFLWCAKEQIRKADAFVYVYDITRHETFTAAQRWHDIVNPHAKRPNLPKLLLGNMLDIRHKSAVPAIEAKEYGVPEGMKHVECSAKSGKNISAAFFILANDVITYRRLGGHAQIGTTPRDPNFSLFQIHEAPEVENVPDTADYTHVFRILLMGLPRTGKSAVRLRYCRNYFSMDYYASAGLEYSTRSLLVDGEKVKIQVWDISGDPVYDATRRNYYKGANGFMILYDVTNQKSFDCVEGLVKELDMYGQSECPKVIIGNKADKKAKQEVCSRKASEWAQGWRLPLLETSAKHGSSIDAAFLKMVTGLKERLSPWKQVYNFSK